MRANPKALLEERLRLLQGNLRLGEVDELALAETRERQFFLRPIVASFVQKFNGGPDLH